MSKLEKQFKQEAEYILPGEKTKARLKEHLFGSTKGKKQTVYRKKFAIAFSMVCVILCVCAGLYFGLKTDPIAPVPISETFITIDINPSFEIITDKNDKVTSVTGLNSDARIVLFHENYTGLNIDVAVEKLIAKSISLGYVVNQNIEILASNENSQKENDILSMLSDKIQATLTTYNASSTVKIKNDISSGLSGKEALIEEACLKLGLSEQDAKNLSSGEINKLLKNYDEEILDQLEDILEAEYENANLSELDEEALEDALDNLKEQWKNLYGDEDEEEDEENQDTSTDTSEENNEDESEEEEETTNE